MMARESLVAFFRRSRYRAGLRKVWITTRGKDGFVLVSRWRLLAAAFSRKDVRLYG